MYKVGDEVYVKAKVVEVDDGYVRIRTEGYGERTFTVNFSGLNPKNYTQGLADAWELVKKIYDTKCEDVKDIFEEGFWEIINNRTAEEALAKIEAYEKEKEIKVKDIVIYHDCPGTGVVTYVDSEHATVMWKNGRFGEYQKCYLERTGETADGLDDLLRQIGE